MASQIPSSIRRWEYTTTAHGLENDMSLQTTSLPTPTPDQHLVRVATAAVNPVDYKIAEVPFVQRWVLPKPASPGSDFSGYIVVPAAGSNLKPGDAVFGLTGTTPMCGGSLSEYAIAPKTQVALVPEGVSLADTTAIGVAGVTALQSIMPYVKAGSRVFINGGSGGVGIFGIQIAKALGCHVTVTCSTANVEMCQSLGADEVIDYKSVDMMTALKEMGRKEKFDLLVDNVCNNTDLFYSAHEFSNSSAIYSFVGAAPKLSIFAFVLKASLLPSFLGGGRINFKMLMVKRDEKALAQIAMWMKEGKVRAVTDEVFEFEKAADAIRKLKTGRAKGKILVKVTEEK